MISEKEAAKIYPQGNTTVIRKSDPRWTSDHPRGLGERAVGNNPLTTMNQKIAAHAAGEVDTSSLESITDTAPLGTTMDVPRGGDLVHVELREGKDGRYWHTRWVSKNAAHQ